MKDIDHRHIKGSLLIGGLTFCLAVAISFLSRLIISGVGVFAALLILLFIVAIGVIFDVIGVAATAGIEGPFHAKAAKKIAGGQRSGDAGKKCRSSGHLLL